MLSQFKAELYATERVPELGSETIIIPVVIGESGGTKLTINKRPRNKQCLSKTWRFYLASILPKKNITRVRRWECDQVENRAIIFGRIPPVLPFTRKNLRTDKPVTGSSGTTLLLCRSRLRAHWLEVRPRMKKSRWTGIQSSTVARNTQSRTCLTLQRTSRDFHLFIEMMFHPTPVYFHSYSYYSPFPPICWHS